MLFSVILETISHRRGGFPKDVREKYTAKFVEGIFGVSSSHNSKAIEVDSRISASGPRLGTHDIPSYVPPICIADPTIPSLWRMIRTTLFKLLKPLSIFIERAYSFYDSNHSF